MHSFYYLIFKKIIKNFSFQKILQLEISLNSDTILKTI